MNAAIKDEKSNDDDTEPLSSTWSLRFTAERPPAVLTFLSEHGLRGHSFGFLLGARVQQVPPAGAARGAAGRRTHGP